MHSVRKCIIFCLISVLFSAIFMTTAFANGSQSYGEEIESFDVSGDADSSVTVKLYEKDGEYILVVSGEGRMIEFCSSAEIPWLEYADGIVSVTVGKGVESLSKFFFHNCSSLEELRIYETRLTLIADKQYIPYTAKIYGHFNSTAYSYVFENYPSRFFAICNFTDSACSECGYVCENHSGGVPTCTDGGKCEICGVEYISANGHRLSSLVPEEPATCYSVGVYAHYACLDCETFFDKNSQPTTRNALEFTREHDFGELRKYVAPTCTDAGLIAHYECSMCLNHFNESKEKIDDIFISAMGHIGGEATCLSGAVCERCDVVYTEADLTNHDYGTAFKYNESSHWLECICGYTSGLSNHTLVDKVLKESTEYEMGILESSCSCGYRTNKYISKLPPTVNSELEKENNFPFAAVIIITVSAISLCACVAVAVILIKKYRK